MLSHELRTPLTPVLASVSELEARSNLSPDLRQTFSMIRRNVELEARLVDDLLDLTRISAGKLRINLQPVDAHAIVREAVSMLRAELDEKQQQLTLRLDALPSYVRGDPLRLRQVVWNLLRNSIKFTPAGGRIVIRTRLEQRQQLLIEVADTGIGLGPSDLKRIFKPFEQPSGGRKVGLGLGLTISRALLDAMEGRIEAQSEGRGRGTTMQVWLALAPHAAEDTAATPHTHHMRILLVEDHPDTARIMSHLLHKYGHKVQVAGSVRAALDLLAQDRRADVLISDIALQDGTGIELVRQLPPAARSIHKIALSGFGSDEDVRRAQDAGFDQYFIKPVDIHRLLGAIARASVKT